MKRRGGASRAARRADRPCPSVAAAAWGASRLGSGSTHDLTAEGARRSCPGTRTCAPSAPACLRPAAAAAAASPACGPCTTRRRESRAARIEAKGGRGRQRTLDFQPCQPMASGQSSPHRTTASLRCDACRTGRSARAFRAQAFQAHVYGVGGKVGAARGGGGRAKRRKGTEGASMGERLRAGEDVGPLTLQVPHPFRVEDEALVADRPAPQLEGVRPHPLLLQPVRCRARRRGP